MGLIILAHIIIIIIFILVNIITFWLVPYLLHNESRINNTIKEIYDPGNVYPLHFIFGLTALYLIIFYEYKDEWRFDYDKAN